MWTGSKALLYMGNILSYVMHIWVFLIDTGNILSVRNLPYLVNESYLITNESLNYIHYVFLTSLKEPSSISLKFSCFSVQ